jgi:hypothetical protein
VQTTVVLIDGIIRNDPPQSFDDDLIPIFTEMGTLIRKMFKISSESDASEAAKYLLFGTASDCSGEYWKAGTRVIKATRKLFSSDEAQTIGNEAVPSSWTMAATDIIFYSYNLWSIWHSDA